MCDVRSKMYDGRCKKKDGKWPPSFARLSTEKECKNMNKE